MQNSLVTQSIVCEPHGAGLLALARLLSLETVEEVEKSLAQKGMRAMNIDRGWILIWSAVVPYLPGECLLDFIRGASIKILKAMSSQTLDLLTERAVSLVFCLGTV